MVPKCVKLIDSTRKHFVCLWCEGKESAQIYANALEENGIDSVLGVCPQCIEKNHADSLKGTEWELKLSPVF